VSRSTRVPVVPSANDGPVPVLIATELTLARSGALDADLIAQHALLRHRLHEAAAVLGGRATTSRNDRHRPTAPLGHPVGRHERDRQLPGPALAVALHAVVPGAGIRPTSANVDLIAIYLRTVGTVVRLWCRRAGES
jgi:hypothetical protein